MTNPEEPNKAVELARELALAYLVVFGAEGQRSEAQKRVMADMEYRGYIYRTTIVADGGNAEERWTSAEGQRIFVLNTKTLIQRGLTLGNETKPVKARKR